MLALCLAYPFDKILGGKGFGQAKCIEVGPQFTRHLIKGRLSLGTLILRPVMILPRLDQLSFRLPHFRQRLALPGA